MKYQITTVGNGIMVMPAPDLSRDRWFHDKDVYVFPTWPEASKWIGDQFRAESEVGGTEK